MRARTFLVVFALVLINACSTFEIGIETPSNAKDTTWSSALATSTRITPPARPAKSSVSPLPTPAVASPTPANNLICNSESDSLTCFDEVLNVRFTYPAAWGMIRSELSQGSCGGYAYSYKFEHSPVLEVSGTSLDYCIPGRGGSLTFPFTGFKYRNGDGMVGTRRACEPDDMFAGAQECRYVQPGVIVATEFPSVEPGVGDCIAKGPGVIQSPTQFIAIDLPLESKVQGLKFAIDILSPQAKNALFATIGGPSTGPECQDPTNKAKFKQALQDLWEAIQTGQVDAETSRNLARVEMLATSFQIVQP